MPINDIALGDFSAENDKNLSEYFIDNTHSYQSAKDFGDHRYILLGRTGSGKSAILSHIHQCYQDDERYICAFIKPGTSHLNFIAQTDAFNEFKKNDSLQPVLYKLLWQYVIMVSVLREKYGSNGPLRKGQILIREDLTAYKFLRKVSELSQENQTFSDIFISLIKEINISIKGLSVKSGNSHSHEVIRGLIKETEYFHENGFWDIVGSSKLYLLFDDLDLGWNPEDKDQQLLLRGLFEIMKDFAYKARVKPLIALRTNILDGLKLPQKEKFENNILSISWTKPNLEKMLLLRLQKYGGVDTQDSFEVLFDFTEDFNPIDYMIERTLYRPRDLIAFCKFSITDASISGAEKIYKTHILSSENKYSKSRLQALSDEWKYLYPDLDLFVKLVSKIYLSNGYGQNFQPRDLRNILIEVKEIILTEPDKNNSHYGSLVWVNSYFPDNNDPYGITSILFRLGLLAFSNGYENFKFIYELDDLPPITEETEFRFHPLLQAIPLHMPYSKSENPWL